MAGRKQGRKDGVQCQNQGRDVEKDAHLMVYRWEGQVRVRTKSFW